MRSIFAQLSLVLLGVFTEASASPQTWLKPDVNLVGNQVGARFGSEVACSSPALDSNARSVIAVGAPFANAGKGLVYLFDPANPLNAFDTLSAGETQSGGQFGTAIEFIRDLNGDGIEELVVGAPNTDGQNGGRIFGFLSLVQGSSLGYVLCGSEAGGAGFGKQIQAIRSADGAVTTTVVIGAPTQSAIYGYSLQILSESTCFFNQEQDLTRNGVMDSGYGSSLAQVSIAGVAAALAVSVPAVGAFGEVVLEHAIDLLLPQELPINGSAGSSSEIVGESVAGSYFSNLFAVGNPRGSEGRGIVSVYSTEVSPSRLICNMEISVAENSSSFGRTLAHLGMSFSGLVGDGQVAVAVSRSEPSTGGAITLFGASLSGCTGMFELNNCQDDPLQEQGAALAGGEFCQLSVGGTTTRMLVSGSPGWHGGQGRVDVSFEGKEFLTPVACGSSPEAQAEISPVLSPSATPSVSVGTLSPTPVITATPIQTGVVLLVSPSATPTGTQPTQTALPESGTAQPTASSTPESPTPQPTMIVGQQPQETPVQTSAPVVTTPDVSSEGPTPAPAVTSTPAMDPSVAPQPDPTPTKGTDGGGVSVASTPIAVSPGIAGLPTPEIIAEGGRTEVIMPSVTPQLSQAQQKRAIRTLVSKKKMTRSRAAALLADPANLTVTYIVQYSMISRAVAFSFIQSAYADGGSSKRTSRVTKIRSRNNRVTLARLQPGATYQVSYQIEIALKKPQVVLGVTRRSGSRRFKS